MGASAQVVELAAVRRVRNELLGNSVVVESAAGQVIVTFASAEAADEMYAALWLGSVTTSALAPHQAPLASAAQGTGRGDARPAAGDRGHGRRGGGHGRRRRRGRGPAPRLAVGVRGRGAASRWRSPRCGCTAGSPGRRSASNWSADNARDPGMKKDDIHEIVKRLEPSDISKVVLVLRAGFGISVDNFYRFDQDYVVLRGREAGTNDDGRGFFVPYDEIVYLKIERLLHANDLRKIYGDPIVSALDELEEEVETPEGGEEMPTPAPVGPAKPAAPMSPGDIARQNLLERIRAARTSVTAIKSNGK